MNMGENLRPPDICMRSLTRSMPDQMAVVVRKTGIARMQPAVADGFFGGPRRSCGTPSEKGRAAGHDFAHALRIRVVDFQIGFRDGQAHSVGIDIAVPMDARNTGNLGLAVDLFEIHPKGVKKAEHVRAPERPHPWWRFGFG